MKRNSPTISGSSILTKRYSNCYLHAYGTVQPLKTAVSLRDLVNMIGAHDFHVKFESKLVSRCFLCKLPQTLASWGFQNEIARVCNQNISSKRVPLIFSEWSSKQRHTIKTDLNQKATIKWWGMSFCSTNTRIVDRFRLVTGQNTTRPKHPRL